MKHNKKQETALLKEITSGKYQDCYLVYNRKSTDEADNQKNSISYQKSENTRFAYRENLPLAPITLAGFCTNGVISEKHSGFKEGDDLLITDEGVVQYRIDRPKFQQLLQHLSRGYFKGMICLCWDRISRNKGDDTIVRKLMRKGVDVRFVYATYDKSSAGELHMDIDGMFAQHHSRVTSEKVTISTRNSRQKGICTYRAPIGYLNTGRMDHKPLDPVRAPIIKDMFQLYATGDWSLADIARHAATQGFTTVPMRPRRSKEEMLADEGEEVVRDKISRPVTENHISRILTNPFYTGKLLDSDGQYIASASHEALIDEDTFNQVQALLAKKKVSVHYAEKLDHPLRGVVRCAYCHRVYTPYEKKGILYFNARCPKGCANTKKNCNFDFITEKIRGLIANLYFTEDELADLEARASTDISLLEERRIEEYGEIERQKKRIQDELSYLRANRLTLLKAGVYSPESLVAEQSRLEGEYDGLHQKEMISEEAMRELMKDVITLSELIKSSITHYDFANPHEKENIVRVIFSELSIAQDRLEYKVKRGFESFTDRLSAVCDPTAWLSELYRDRKLISTNIRTLQKWFTINKLEIDRAA